ncbi:BQ5605_C003g02434 [Microbotryum silenes-dioicae]|uniref:BQ5605_C003g02434 protein n=1 Tax=Microbotryum silenes-dioicae TaxID=796604 RepID=A0A2X0M556_9BASI|nr:BQ5605_C003g02434 [Microbotryum silenes-dioicae]
MIGIWLKLISDQGLSAQLQSVGCSRPTTFIALSLSHLCMSHRGTSSTPKMRPTRLGLLVALATTTLFLQPTHAYAPAHGVDYSMHQRARSAFSALGSVDDQFNALAPLDPEQHFLNNSKRAEIPRDVSITLTQVEVPPISFFWTMLSINDSVRAIPQCAVVRVGTMDNPGSPAVTVPPLYYAVTPIDSQFLPMVMYGASNVGGNFTYTANLPVGTTFSFGMVDSNGTSGGAIYPLYTIVPGFSNCTVRTKDNPVLSFTVNPPNNPCQEFKVSIKNGVAPYTVGIIAGQSGLLAAALNVNSSDIYVQNVVPAGQIFNLYVFDGAGAFSLASPNITSGLYFYSCQTISDNSGTTGADGGSPPIGAIVGGVVGGIVGAALIALLAWWWMRRRSNKVEEQFQTQQHVPEYTNVDGSKPAVSPFIVSPREGKLDEMEWDASTHMTSPSRPTQAGAEYDHPYLQPMNPHSLPHNACQFSPPPLQVPLRTGSGSPVSPITPVSYNSTGAESSRSGHGRAFNWPAPSSSTRGAMSHQEAYGTSTGGSMHDPLSATSYSTAVSSTGVDGLVDPDEFQPRVTRGYPGPPPPPGGRLA